MKAADHREKVRDAVQGWFDQTVSRNPKALIDAIMTTGGVEALVAENERLKALEPEYPFIAVHIPSHWRGPEITVQMMKVIADADVYEVRLSRHSHDDTPQCQWSFIDAQEAPALRQSVAELTAALEEIRDLNGTPCSRRSVAIACQALALNKVGEGS